LVSCSYFTLERHTGGRRFRVGAAGECRVVVCVSGRGELESADDTYHLSTGDVVLLPAELGECTCLPAGEITVLECGIPV
jgi:mannose-6-phosphate isomerase